MPKCGKHNYCGDAPGGAAWFLAIVNTSKIHKSLEIKGFLCIIMISIQYGLYPQSLPAGLRNPSSTANRFLVFWFF